MSDAKPAFEKKTLPDGTEVVTLIKKPKESEDEDKKPAPAKGKGDKA